MSDMSFVSGYYVVITKGCSMDEILVVQERPTRVDVNDETMRRK